MRKPLVALFSIVSIAASADTAVPGGGKERRDIPDKYKWNLAALYPNEAAWNTARASLAQRIPQLARFQGKLGVSAAALYEALDAIYKLSNELERLYVY